MLANAFTRESKSSPEEQLTIDNEINLVKLYPPSVCLTGCPLITLLPTISLKCI